MRRDTKQNRLSHLVPLPRRGSTRSRGTNWAQVQEQVEAALKFPFHTDQESVSISAGSTASLSLMLLPFSPGEYK